jgi:hypothetical protein
MANKLSTALVALIALGRKALDDENRAEVSRLAFIDKLIADGFTSTNILPKKKLPAGFNGDWMRPQLLLVGAATIKIKGKRLSDADLVRYADDAVSNKVLLSGTPKGTLRDENGKTLTTWAGQADSWLGKVRLALIEREAQKLADELGDTAGTPRTPTGAKDVVLGYLQKAYNKTFKDAEALSCDLDDAQKALRAAAKAFGGTLNAPKQK